MSLKRAHIGNRLYQILLETGNQLLDHLEEEDLPEYDPSNGVASLSFIMFMDMVGATGNAEVRVIAFNEYARITTTWDMYKDGVEKRSMESGIDKVP